MNLAELMRPTNLNDVIGNEHIVNPLRKQLADDTLSQTLMFTGQYGSGKTTFAKIIAKEIEADVTEIDCGSEGTIDNIRQLIVSATHSSLFSPKKVFIFDEAHKLSQVSQTALLKTLEEPNKNIHFILLTNEPQKLLKTIQSRCVVYETRPATNEQVGIAVGKVKDKFNVTFEDNNDFWSVIEIAEGSFRVIYSLLEKIITAAGPNGHISSIDFRNIVGSYKDEIVNNENLPKALVEGNIEIALSSLNTLTDTSTPFATTMSIYKYLRKGYIEKWAREEHVKYILVDITSLISSKLVNWYDIERLIWKYL